MEEQPDFEMRRLWGPGMAEDVSLPIHEVESSAVGISSTMIAQAYFNEIHDCVSLFTL